MTRTKITIRPGVTTGRQAAKFIDDALAAKEKTIKDLHEKWGLNRMQLSRWRNGSMLSDRGAHLVASVLRWLGADVTITT